MDVINPLSLLEVMINEDTNEDDDCIIIENNDVNENVARGKNIFKGVYQAEIMEVEDDPLYVEPSEVYNNTKDVNMTTLWVTTNINNLSNESYSETAYRKKNYPNIYEVLKEKLHCTICQNHIGCDIRIHPSSFEHPVLKVLSCERCISTYSTIHFVQNEKGKEVSCRWCGKASFGGGTALRTCQQCPFSFCELCLFNNCSDYNSPIFPWTCFVCNMRVLWPARATLWALRSLISLLISSPDNPLANINGDISICCKNKRRKKQQIKKKKLETSLAPPPLDIDQLVPPHLLNGSDEYSVMPQTPSLNGFKIVKCNSDTNKFRIVKSKPKPKPKPKSKAQVKKQKRQAPIQQISQTPHLVPHVSPDTCLKTPDKKSHWLRTKLIGYIADFNQLKTKLEDIENSLYDEENNEETDDKINAITTLLSLHGDLLKSCQLNLINEWTERKARTVLESYNTNILERDAPIKMTPVSLNFSELTSQKYIASNTSSKKESPKTRSSKNRDQGHQIQLVNKSNYIIKDCYVRLNKIRMPLDMEN